MSGSGAELRCELPGGGHALFTSRDDGNMSSVGGLGAERGAENRERLRARLGLDGLARGYQVHGSTVELVREIPSQELDREALPRADGQATALPGLGTMVLAADCLPVALGREGAVAIIHAGWRGLAAGVLERGLESLERLGDGSGVVGEIGAVIGPAAGPCCYQVGPEVQRALGLPGRERDAIDLAAIAQQRLTAAGVGHVSRLGGCTICQERFFSHRREGAAAGRIAGVAWLS